VIEILENKPLFQCKEAGYKPGEDVYAAFGRTNSGRLLSVFFVYTRDRRAIIVSARDMSEKERSKTPVSNVSTYQEIGAFWDEHDATEFGEQTSTKFRVHISSQHRYYPLDRDLSFEVRRIAEQHGISEETLLNMWIREKIDQLYTVDEEHS